MVLFKELTVRAGDVTGGPLTNFPLLVSITDSDLQQNARPDGFDIFFTKSDETTVIPYERESYDNTTGKLVAWVLVDLSDTIDNTIFMFYGNPDAIDQQDPLPVWDTRFNDVFHYNQTSPLPWLNSSVGKNFTLDIGTIAPVSTSGQIDNGSTHSPTNTIFKMASTGIISPTDYFVSEWIKRDSTTTPFNFIEHFASDTNFTFSFTDVIIANGDFTPNDARIAYCGPGLSFFAGDLSDLAYHHVAFRVTSGTTLDIFFDGDFVSSNTLTFFEIISFDDVQIGGIVGAVGGVDLRAKVDETRIAFNSNFSNGFIKTSFDNQKTTGQGAGNFVKVGVQQQNIISNNYLLLSQGAIDESSSIINAVCGDSSLLIGDVVRLLPVGTGEGFTQPDDLLPRVGIVNTLGTAAYGIIVGGDVKGVYSEGEIIFDSNGLAQGIIASFFGDGVRICTQGRCLAFVNGKIPINIGDKLTASTNGLVKAFFGSDQVTAIALQTLSATTIEDMLYEDLEIMEYEDLINMIYELVLTVKNSIIAVDVQREGAI